jgi:glycosyltransferase 2 family protein
MAGSRSVSMKGRVLFWLKLCVSAALLFYLFTLIDLDGLVERLRNVDLRYLVIAFVLLLVQVGLSSIKWQVILRSDGVLMRLPFLIKTYMIGNFISLFLPTSFGGDIYRVIAARGVNQDLAKSTSSVLFDRLSGLFALISICMIAYVVLPEQPYGVAVLVLYVLGVAGFFVVSSNAVGRLIEASKIGLVRKSGKILLSFRNYRRNPSAMLLILLLSFLFQFNIVVINKVYTTALGLNVDFGILLVIIPLIYLTEVLPISINGLGVRESAFAFFFVQIGLTVGDALAVSVLIVGMRYLVGLLGGSLLLATVISSRAGPVAPRSDTSAPAPRN